MRRVAVQNSKASSHCLKQVFFIFERLTIEKANNQRPFAVIRIRFVMKTNSWEGKAPWTQVLLLSSLRLKECPWFFQLFSAFFFYLGRMEFTVRGRNEGQLKWRNLGGIIRPWIARCIKVRIDEYMKVSVCTNLDVYCMLPFGNSINRESHSRPLPLGTKANVAQKFTKVVWSSCYSVTLLLCYPLLLRRIYI